MAKRAKRQVEKWGGRKLQATVNGKEVCVKKDPHNLTCYMNPPKENGTGRERIWLGRNLGKAAHEFWSYVEQAYEQQLHKLENVQTVKKLRLSYTEDAQVEQLQKLLERREGDESLEEWRRRVWNNDSIPFSIEQLIPQEELAKIFRRWLEDPYECSVRVGDERIANLDKLAANDPIKLKEMGNHYYNWIPTHREQAAETERKKIVSWWNDFIRITAKTYLDELAKADVEHYTQTVVAIAEKGDWSKTWVSHRFGACRTVINTYAKRLEDKSLAMRVIGWFKDYPAPASVNHKSEDFDPNRLTKKQWLELLELVSSRTETRTQKEWRAIVLFALNTCSHGVTCRNITVANINGNELRMRRGKRGKSPKIAMLWDDTLEAIAEFRQGKISSSRFLFPTRNGGQYSAGGFYDYWSKHIRPNLSWHFDFDQLRDTGRYGAETGNASPNAIRMVMGHRIDGQDDAYLFRHPELTQTAVDAIYKYYMQ